MFDSSAILNPDIFLQSVTFLYPVPILATSELSFDPTRQRATKRQNSMKSLEESEISFYYKVLIIFSDLQPYVLPLGTVPSSNMYPLNFSTCQSEFTSPLVPSLKASNVTFGGKNYKDISIQYRQTRTIIL